MLIPSQFFLWSKYNSSLIVWTIYYWHAYKKQHNSHPSSMARGVDRDPSQRAAPLLFYSFILAHNSDRRVFTHYPKYQSTKASILDREMLQYTYSNKARDTNPAKILNKCSCKIQNQCVASLHCFCNPSQNPLVECNKACFLTYRQPENVSRPVQIHWNFNWHLIQ